MTKLQNQPDWSPRVPQHKIRQLYQQDARRIFDDECVTEVGFALMARCQSFLEACQAVQGQVSCPNCGGQVPHPGREEAVLACTACGWSLPWEAYFKSLQGKQLSGAEPVRKLFRQFIREFPKAQTYQEKMLLVDQLIHGYHWHAKFGPTRPAAVNLIQGRLPDVIAFLDDLHAGECGTAGLQGSHARWRGNSKNVSGWLNKTD